MNHHEVIISWLVVMLEAKLEEELEQGSKATQVGREGSKAEPKEAQLIDWLAHGP